MTRYLPCLLLPAVLSGCANGPLPTANAEGYALSVEEAYNRLVSSDMVEMRDAFQCGLLVHLHPRGIPNESVTWSVSSSGREMFSFTAHLVPLADGRVTTRVSVSADERGGEAYDGNQKYVRPAMNQPIRPAIEEQIAALLEGRSFDRKRVQVAWNEGCQIQRTILQNGRKLRVDEVPPTGMKMDLPRRTTWDDARSSGGWGR
jgi:hypothetical protein